jgi:hypothetical protein
VLFSSLFGENSVFCFGTFKQFHFSQSALSFFAMPAKTDAKAKTAPKADAKAKTDAKAKPSAKK